MMLPNDIKNEVVQNLCANFRKPTADVIASLAYYQRMFLRENDKVDDKRLKSNINPMSPLKEMD